MAKVAKSKSAAPAADDAPEALTPAQKAARTRAANKAKRAAEAAEEAARVAASTEVTAVAPEDTPKGTVGSTPASPEPVAAKDAPKGSVKTAKTSKASKSSTASTDRADAAAGQSAKRAAAKTLDAGPTADDDDDDDGDDAPTAIDHDSWVGDDYDEADDDGDQVELDRQALDFVNRAIGAGEVTIGGASAANAKSSQATGRDAAEPTSEKAAKKSKKASSDGAGATETGPAQRGSAKAGSAKAGKVDSTAEPEPSAKKAAKAKAAGVPLPSQAELDRLQLDKTRPADDDDDDDGDGEDGQRRIGFADLGLIEPLQRAVADMGFEYPTRIQAQAIPRLLDRDTDLVGLAQTGTGKTAAFGLPALHRLHVHTRVPQVLVLAPTRELCLQITVELGSFAKHMPDVDIAPVYGGADITRQIKQIRRGVQIVVATPGRLRDLIRRRAVDLQHVSTLVLDEADEMLNMGFKEEIDDILESIPDEAHTWLFSATMPEDVRRIAAEYMDQPIEVQSGERNSANADISHRYVITRPKERFGVLRRFLDYDPEMYGLIFVRTRADAKEFADQLIAEGYNADALHGDLSQAQRDNVMGRFRARRLQVLVATDVAARGIDVTGITHVFHLNLPDDLSFYTHRAGRTGRAGAEGISLALVHPKDVRILRSIERLIKARFEETTIPTGPKIIERRLLASMRALRKVEVADGLEPYREAIEDALDGLSREDIIARVASDSFDKLLSDYRFAPDLNDQRGREVAKQEGRRDRDDRPGRSGGRHDDANMERLFINVGAMDVGGRKGNLLGMLCDAADIKGSDIGRITMNKTHTFFDVDKSVARQVIERLSELHFDGRPVRINPADEGGGDSGGSDGDRGGYGGRESRGGYGGGGHRRDRDDRRGGHRDDRRGGGRGGWRN